MIPTKATDANGRFLFEGLTAGSYSLMFAAERFVSLQFGQATPQETERRVELKDGEHFDKADISLPPTTAIEGRLLDEFGDPVPGIRVQPALVQFIAGKRRLVPAGSGSMPPPRPTISGRSGSSTCRPGTTTWSRSPGRSPVPTIHPASRSRTFQARRSRWTPRLCGWNWGRTCPASRFSSRRRRWRRFPGC